MVAASRVVMGVALHAHVSGQPFRLRPLRQALQHVQAQGAAVWIADTDRIAAAWQSQPWRADGRLPVIGRRRAA